MGVGRRGAHPRSRRSVKSLVRMNLALPPNARHPCENLSCRIHGSRSLRRSEEAGFEVRQRGHGLASSAARRDICRRVSCRAALIRISTCRRFSMRCRHGGLHVRRPDDADPTRPCAQVSAATSATCAHLLRRRRCMVIIEHVLTLLGIDIGANNPFSSAPRWSTTGKVMPTTSSIASSH